jgi:hypothetical protein
VSSLLRGVVSVTRTKRRRFLWCAWWSGEPTADPFRPPDAWSGGARTEDEARAAAEKAAGFTLRPVAGRWAGAFLRIRAGLPPFPRARREPGPDDAGAPSEKPGETPARPVDPYALLGVPRGAPLDVVKAAFKKKALEHHPDHGGDAATFMALKRAYDGIVRRRARPQPVAKRAVTKRGRPH